MLFAFHCFDHPESTALRQRTRADHLAYLDRLKDGLVLAGALLDDDGATPCGSLLVLDLPDRAAAEAFARDDPYASAGLFARVEIQPFRQARPIRPG